jgi:hypothetical protein
VGSALVEARGDPVRQLPRHTEAARLLGMERQKHRRRRHVTPPAVKIG